MPGRDLPGQEELNTWLGERLTLEEMNLRLVEGDGWITIESPSYFIAPQLEEILSDSLAALELPLMELSSYLVNRH